MELLKLVKRPMTWVLLILLHGGIGFSTVVAALGVRSVTPDVRDAILRNVTLPGILPQTATFVYIFGSIMLAILAASSIGSEYSWGTLRPILATGIPRGRFLGAKLLALAVVALGFVVLPMLMSAALAVPLALWLDQPLMTGTVDLAWFGQLAAMIGRTYLLIVVPGLIAFLVGLAGRSQAAGIGAALGIMIGEQIVAVLLTGLNLGWSRAVVDLLPGQSSAAINNFYNGLGDLGAAPPPPGTLSEGQALLTLGVYSLVCLVVAFLVFRRRDVRGAA
jgi:ABC-type transport system involved in multi-copper enzyme maturation permease subunit